MVWLITEPTDNTEIRNLGVVIRPNWVAIEEADATFLPKAINLNNRTVSGPTNDPTAITNAFLMYCKEDTSGNPELFGINEASEILQFTKGLPTLATPGEIFLPGGLIMKWGTVSISTTATNLTYATAFPTATLAVFLTQFENSFTTNDPIAYSYTASKFTHIKDGGTRLYKYLALGY